MVEWEFNSLEYEEALHRYTKRMQSRRMLSRQETDRLIRNVRAFLNSDEMRTLAHASSR